MHISYEPPSLMFRIRKAYRMVNDVKPIAHAVLILGFLKCENLVHTKITPLYTEVNSCRNNYVSTHSLRRRTSDIHLARSGDQ